MRWLDCSCDTKHSEGKAHDGIEILIRFRIKRYLLEDYCKDYLQATSTRLLEWTREITVNANCCPSKFKLTSQRFEEFFNTVGEQISCR